MRREYFMMKSRLLLALAVASFTSNVVAAEAAVVVVEAGAQVTEAAVVAGTEAVATMAKAVANPSVYAKMAAFVSAAVTKASVVVPSKEATVAFASNNKYALAAVGAVAAIAGVYRVYSKAPAQAKNK